MPLSTACPAILPYRSVSRPGKPGQIRTVPSPRADCCWLLSSTGSSTLETAALKRNTNARNRRGGILVELKTFRGGIHPPYQKEATAHKATEDLSLPAEVVIPMQQHLS